MDKCCGTWMLLELLPSKSFPIHHSRLYGLANAGVVTPQNQKVRLYWLPEVHRCGNRHQRVGVGGELQSSGGAGWREMQLPVMRIDYCLVSGRRGGTSRWTNSSRSSAIVTPWCRVE
jgi:hypothetical protein